MRRSVCSAVLLALVIAAGPAPATPPSHDPRLHACADDYFAARSHHLQIYGRQLQEISRLTGAELLIEVGDLLERMRGSFEFNRTVFFACLNGVINPSPSSAGAPVARLAAGTVADC